MLIKFRVANSLLGFINYHSLIEFVNFLEAKFTTVIITLYIDNYK